jgi:deazaflavin-dependent oxidoreductase (nitroreductase family)
MDGLHESTVPGGARSTRVPRWVPVFNRLVRPLLARGVPMGPNALVTIRGRRTGLPRTTPITIMEASGRRWLVAPFGEVDWVRNLRAAGSATLIVRGRPEHVSASELTREAAGGFFRDVHSPLARRNGPLAMWIVRTIDKINIDNPLETAQRCPVFELHRYAAD